MTRTRAFVGPVRERIEPSYVTVDNRDEEAEFWHIVFCAILPGEFIPAFGKAASEFLNGNSR